MYLCVSGVYEEVRAMREACGDAHMKTILAVGELGTLANVYRASLTCMMAGMQLHFLDPGYWVLETGFWILGLRFWKLGSGYWVLGSRYWVLDNGYPKTGFWILGPGNWVLDTGS